MRYADFLARLTGLCVAVAGAALAGRELLFQVPGDIRGVGVVAPGALADPAAATVGVGAAFVVAGLAVLVGWGRAAAVSVGGAAAVIAVASLAVGVGSVIVVLSVGVVALALVLAGASTGGHAAR
jgi:hypothetical protein